MCIGAKIPVSSPNASENVNGRMAVQRPTDEIPVSYAVLFIINNRRSLVSLSAVNFISQYIYTIIISCSV